MEEFSYQVKNGKVCITGYNGIEEQIIVPSVLNGYPVSIIGKKAFWGKKKLRSIHLPDTIEKVEEWAFAGCRELSDIWFLGQKASDNSLVLENHIFHNCVALRFVYFGTMKQSLARLIACAATKLHAEYLLSPVSAGSEQWYQSLDAKLLQILEESEEAALRNLVYCAEEDMLEKQQTCLYQQMCEKAELAFLRLVYSEKLTSAVYEKLKSFLLQRNKGGPTEEAWDVMIKSEEDSLLYCDKLFEIGGIHAGNIDLILQTLENTGVELKAYILKKWQNQRNAENIWQLLNLGDGIPEERI